MTRQELADLKAETMACWWPSHITGVTRPDWTGIAGELDALLERENSIPGNSLARLHHVRKLRQLAHDKAEEVRRCGWCKKPLPQASPEFPFCNQEHADAWLNSQTSYR